MILRCLDGPMRGSIYTVDEDGAEIGRSPACRISIDDGEASREHARISWDNGFRIQDLGSTNGVFVNGEKIIGLHRLDNGDRVRVGNSLFVAEEITPPVETAAGAGETIPVPHHERPRHLLRNLTWVALLLVAIFAAWWIFGDRLLKQPPDTPPITELQPEEQDDEEELSPFAPVIEEDDLALLEMARDEAEPSWEEEDPGASSETTPAEQQPDPPPADEAATAAPRLAGYLWVDTLPSGASVSLNGELKGQTPLLLSQLPPGRYSLTFSLDYHEPAERFFELPTDGEQKVVTLRQLNGTCRVTSNPTGASVWLGPKLLGETPLIVAGLAPGDHPLRLALPGHTALNVQATILPDRFTAASADLTPQFGTLVVTSIPPGMLIRIDDTIQGSTPAAAPGEAASLPLELDGIGAGRHVVQATLAEESAEPQTIEMVAGDRQELRIVIWRPTVRLRMTNGKSWVAMLAGETTDSYLLVSYTHEVMRVARQLVESMEPLTQEEQQRLLQQLQNRE